MKVNNFIIEKNDLTDLYIKCLNSFILHDVDVDLYTYDVTNISKITKELSPKINVINADKILKMSYREKCGTDRVFSNHFRYVLLLKNKGWWVDADNVMVSSFDNMDKNFILAGYAMRNNKGTVGNGNVIYYNDDKIGLKILTDAVNIVENAKSQVEEYHNGGKFFSLITEKIKNFIVEPNLFNPLVFHQRKLFTQTFSQDIMDFLKGAHTIHLWAMTVGNTVTVIDKDCLYQIMMDYLDKSEKITITKLQRKCTSIMKEYNIEKPD